MHQAGRLRENKHFKDRWWDTLILLVVIAMRVAHRPDVYRQ